MKKPYRADIIAFGIPFLASLLVESSSEGGAVTFHGVVRSLIQGLAGLAGIGTNRILKERAAKPKQDA